MANRVKVFINGKEYIIETEESEEYTRSLAKKLSDRLSSAMKGTSISLVDASILVSLDCLDETLKQSANMDNIRAQVKDYVDDAGEARLKLDEAQRELRSLKAKVSALEKEIASKTSQLDTKNKELELKQRMYESAKVQVDQLTAEKQKAASYTPSYSSSSATSASSYSSRFSSSISSASSAATADTTDKSGMSQISFSTNDLTNGLK